MICLYLYWYFIKHSKLFLICIALNNNHFNPLNFDVFSSMNFSIRYFSSGISMSISSVRGDLLNGSILSFSRCFLMVILSITTFELGSSTGSLMTSPRIGSMKSSGIWLGSDMMASSICYFSFNMLSRTFNIVLNCSSLSYEMILCFCSLAAVDWNNGMENDLYRYDEVPLVPDDLF